VNNRHPNKIREIGGVRLKKPVTPSFTVLYVKCPHCGATCSKRIDLNNVGTPTKAMICQNGECKKDFVTRVFVKVETTEHKIE
jgi:hypothetical protein